MAKTWLPLNAPAIDPIDRTMKRYVIIVNEVQKRSFKSSSVGPFIDSAKP